MRTLTTLRRRLRGRPDAGYSLVELIVAMGIMSVVLAIVASAVVMMTRNVVTTTNLSSSTDDIRAAFSRLDRQVRYATGINSPTRVGNTWRVEFEGLDGDGASTCRQWRLVTDTDTLQQRSWSAASPPSSAPAWISVAGGISNNPTSQPPFTFVAATDANPMQGLEVTLVGRKPAPGSPSVTLKTSIRGRNTTIKTTSASTPVCNPTWVNS
jgi:prepilin-type N-terminal cleavage/methylation domain-containing protein